MLRPLLLLGLLAGLGHCELPCELYDVTTLVRHSEPAAKLIPRASEEINMLSHHRRYTQAPWEPDFPNSVYEVHSRTNAIGLQTNFEDVTGVPDGLQESGLTCLDASSPSCVGWTFEGFRDSSWFAEDSFLDWRNDSRSDDSTDADRFVVNNNTNYASSKTSRGYQLGHTYGRESVGLLYDALKVRFRPSEPLFLGRWGSFSGIEILPNHGQGQEQLEYTWYQDRDRDQDYPTSAPSAAIPKYLESDKVQTAIFQYTGDQGSVSLGTDGRFPTGNDESVKKYMDVDSRWFRLRIAKEAQSPFDYDVYRVSGPVAKRIIGYNGTVITPYLTKLTDEVCLSMKYYLQEDATVILEISISDDEAQSELSKSTFLLSGTGKTKTQQFLISYPQELKYSNTTKLKLLFKSDQESVLLIRSFRKCSTTGEDTLFAFPHQLRTRGFTTVEDVLPTTTTSPYTWTTPPPRDASRLMTTNVGFALKCPHKSFASVNATRRCYHGGVNVEEYCQCLPGFKGPTCEETCAPNEFGADCGGVCNAVGSLDCKGTRLAAPGLPLECARGYTGVKCETECQAGYYGPDCRLKCGECSDDTCDRFTGKCFAPCKSGYTKDTCQDQLAIVKHFPEIIGGTVGGYKSVEGVIRFDDPIESYPVMKIQYKKQQASSWTSKFIKTSAIATNFRISGLDYKEKYCIRAVPIYKNGDFYRNPNPRTTEFVTKCNDVSFDEIVTILSNGVLSVQWKVTGSKVYPCERIEYNLEINSPVLSEPQVLVLGHNATKAVVNNVSLKRGTIRLRAVDTTNQTLWSNPVTFVDYSPVDESDSLKISHKTSRSMKLYWKSSGITEDVVICKSTVILCEDRKTGEAKMRVKRGEFTLGGLLPFTSYSCYLEKAKLTVSAATLEEAPSGPPVNSLDSPIKSVTNTSAIIEWADASSCEILNGVYDGFIVELWDGDVNLNSSTKDSSHFTVHFENLNPETSYVVRVYHNHPKPVHYASVQFKTRSKAPDAVRDLIAYKRTRSDLWLRWMPPESDLDIVKYRIVLSAPGVPTKTEEFSPPQCDLWHDFVCHKVRGLVPDVNYTATVEAQNGKVSYFGPPTTTVAFTREGEPAAPENVHVVNYTADSITLTWEIPLMLNSNPRFFIVTLDQTDEFKSSETPTLPTQKIVQISEDKRFYELEIKDLNPATTYAITVAAGNRGTRASLTTSTPPKTPPAPRTPELKSKGGFHVIVKGIESSESDGLLSDYLVLVSTNSSTTEVFDHNLSRNLKHQFGSDYMVVAELPKGLDEETIVVSSGSAARGKLSFIEDPPLMPGVYRLAVAAVSTYCRAYSVSVSPAISIIVNRG